MNLFLIFLAVLILILVMAMLTKVWGHNLKKLKGILFFLAFLTIYLGVIYYPILKLGIYLSIFNKLWFQSLVLVLVMLPLLSIGLKRFSTNTITNKLYDIAMFWLGASFVLFSAVVVADILNLFINSKPFHYWANNFRNYNSINYDWSL